MKKRLYRLFATFIIILLIFDILGCKASTEDNPGTVDFPSSTAETIQTISEDTQLSDEKFIFDYESLSPYGQKKVKEDMPYLKSFLDSKPKDGYIFIFITFYYPDFDVDAEADKQLQIDYPELYEVLHHDAKNEPDPVVEDMAYRKRYELRMSILDSVFRPIVLDFCKEDDIKYVNEETYGIITEVGNIYSIIENKSIERFSYENDKSFFYDQWLGLDIDDLKRLLPETQLFQFQPWRLTAHALNKISPRLYNKLKQYKTSNNENIYIDVLFNDNCNAPEIAMSQIKKQYPELYSVLFLKDYKNELYPDAKDKYSDIIHQIYKTYNRSMALEICEEKNIIMIDEYQTGCKLYVKPTDIYFIAEYSLVKYISYEPSLEKEDILTVGL